jgi:hypothetical protein
MLLFPSEVNPTTSEEPVPDLHVVRARTCSSVKTTSAIVEEFCESFSHHFL